jgi:hypothetical protein
VKHLKVAEARARFGEILDEAERGHRCSSSGEESASGCRAWKLATADELLIANLPSAYLLPL